MMRKADDNIKQIKRDLQKWYKNKRFASRNKTVENNTYAKKITSV